MQMSIAVASQEERCGQSQQYTTRNEHFSHHGHSFWSIEEQDVAQIRICGPSLLHSVSLLTGTRVWVEFLDSVTISTGGTSVVVGICMHVRGPFAIIYVNRIILVTIVLTVVGAFQYFQRFWSVVACHIDLCDCYVVIVAVVAVFYSNT